MRDARAASAAFLKRGGTIERSTYMNGTAAEPVLFESAPPYRFLTWLGLIRAGDPRVVRRAVLSIALGWLPLALLTLVHGDFIRPDRGNAFILDFGAHARFLIACPLLILAESLCGPRMAAIARQFIASGLIGEADRTAYQRALDSSRRLLTSRAAEILAFVLAYALVGALLIGKPATPLPLWHGAVSTGHLAATPAGWWGLLVSLPLLLVLLLGWLWRIGVWARFLWLMNRMKLALIASHPDHTGGLRFVGHSPEVFAPLAFTFGVLGAGMVLNQVIHRGAAPAQFKYLAAGIAGFAVVLFAAPTLVFMRRLVQAYHRGMLSYGALALRVGAGFEHKWLLEESIDEQTLRSPDFAPTNSLYSISDHAFRMRRLPFEPRSLAIVAGAALLPFVPIALLSVPFDVLLSKVEGLFV
jgi:hypothetical protein